MYTQEAESIKRYYKLSNEVDHKIINKFFIHLFYRQMSNDTHVLK